MSLIHEWLIERGAKRQRHGNRTLYDHLLGVESLLRQWGQSDETCILGLLHSIYGTPIYEPVLISKSDRKDVAKVVGPDVESLIWEFREWDRRSTPSRGELYVVAHANEIEQGDYAASMRLAGYVRGVSKSRLMYPGLDTKPYYDASAFPVAQLLERCYPAIREELLAIEDFAPEPEPIPRTGEWAVAFFHERGGPNVTNLERCPVTATVLQADAVIKGAPGLAYISRLIPGTDISEHRGPTNMRLRCHLPLVVPEGDVGMRVAGEDHHWAEGKCVVLNDSLPHIAWNHAQSDRLVFIVDLWHPMLTMGERQAMANLNQWIGMEARKLAGKKS